MVEKFKIGDKIRRINYPSSQMAIGDIDIIKDIFPGSNDITLVNYEGIYFTKNFELVTENKKEQIINYQIY